MIDSSLLVLDDLFDTLPSGLLIYRPDGTIVRMNHKAREILGMMENGSAPGLEQWPYYLSPLATVLKTAESDINRAEISLSLPIRDEDSTIGFSVKLIATPDGQTLRTLTFTDITQVMKDRLAFDKIKDELNQSKKLASIGTMIAGVAHEMNNPLTGISMSSSLLKMNLERLKAVPSLPQEPKLLEGLEKALTEVSKIIRANEKAAFLVSDLLAYSKPSQVVMVPVSLHAMMTEFVGALKSHPQFAQLTFNLTGRTERAVLCDRIKLEQVFFNLCKNACDATEGRGSLEVFYSEHEEGGKPFIVTHVKDNGPGIDKTIISRIFDPFFTTKGHSGVGLGLSISYRTVEQHGGLLSVESAKWEGSEFKVSLPVYEETTH